MHVRKALAHLVEGPADEVLTYVTLASQDQVRERAAFHKLKEDPYTSLKVVDLLTTNELITVQVLDDTALIDDVLALRWTFRIRVLQGKLLAIYKTLDHVHHAEGSLAYLSLNLVVLRWIGLLDLASLAKHTLDLVNRAETLHLLGRLDNDGAERHVRLRQLELIVKSLGEHRNCRLRQAWPHDFTILLCRQWDLNVPSLINLMHKNELSRTDLGHLCELVKLCCICGFNKSRRVNYFIGIRKFRPGPSGIVPCIESFLLLVIKLDDIEEASISRKPSFFRPNHSARQLHVCTIFAFDLFVFIPHIALFVYPT